MDTEESSRLSQVFAASCQIYDMLENKKKKHMGVSKEQNQHLARLRDICGLYDITQSQCSEQCVVEVNGWRVDPAGKEAE